MSFWKLNPNLRLFVSINKHQASACWCLTTFLDRTGRGNLTGWFPDTDLVFEYSFHFFLNKGWGQRHQKPPIRTSWAHSPVGTPGCNHLVVDFLLSDAQYKIIMLPPPCWTVGTDLLGFERLQSSKHTFCHCGHISQSFSCLSIKLFFSCNSVVIQIICISEPTSCTQPWSPIIHLWTFALSTYIL